MHLTFLQFNQPRSKDESLAHLKSIFQQATTVSSKTRVKQMKTNTGLKDTFQDYFTDRIFEFTSKLRGSARDKQAALDKMVKQLPQDSKDTMSPVWRIRGKYA